MLGYILAFIALVVSANLHPDGPFILFGMLILGPILLIGLNILFEGLAKGPRQGEGVVAGLVMVLVTLWLMVAFVRWVVSY